jgi:hypothetical protein
LFGGDGFFGIIEKPKRGTGSPVIAPSLEIRLLEWLKNETASNDVFGVIFRQVSSRNEFGSL